MYSLTVQPNPVELGGLGLEEASNWGQPSRLTSTYSEESFIPAMHNFVGLQGPF